MELEAQNNFVYEVLQESNEDLMYETAECLADVFAGVQVGNTFIVDPVIKALQMTKEIFLEFTAKYLGILPNAA